MHAWRNPRAPRLTGHEAVRRLSLAAEASPDDRLLRWLLTGDGERRVRAVVESALAALTAVPESHMLQRMHTEPPLSRLPLPTGPLLAWLKARAKKLKGAFDPALLEEAVPYLGDGWKVARASGLLHVNGTSYDALRRLQELAGVGGEANAHTKRESAYAMPGYEDTPRHGWWAISRGAPNRLPIVRVEADSKGRPLVEHPVPGTLYATAEPEPGQWGQGPLILWVKSPAIGVPAWAVRAPSGRAMLVLDKPRGRGEPLTADAFWKWAYSEGLAEAAQAALPTKAQEEAAAREEAVAKGLGTCGVCFRAHSIHTKSGVLVQHGYAMTGGHGHGHFGMFKAGGDCFGVGWQPFEKSPDATRAWGEECARRSASLAESARAWEAGEHARMWLLHTKPQWGRPTVQECSQYTLPVSDGRQTQRVEEIGPTHPEWAPRVAHKVREMREQSAAYAASSRWYEKAAKGWPAFPVEG